jgi:outer membrane protein
LRQLWQKGELLECSGKCGCGWGVGACCARGRARSEVVRLSFGLMVLWAVTLCAPVSVCAGGAVPIGPQQVISNALVHSQQLQSAQKEIEAAEAKQTQARAQGLPRLSADAQAARYTGLKDSSFGPILEIPAIDNRYGAGVSVSQPAFTGGRIKGQKESASYQKRAAQHDRTGVEADVILQAMTAYWNWSKAFYSVESLRSAVARMEAHAKDLHNMHEAGLATDNDTLATDVLLDQTRLQLEEATRRVDLSVARIRFLTGQNLPEDSKPNEAQAAPDAALPGETTLLAAAWTNRAERLARQLEVKSSEAIIKQNRADYYPQVSLTARYEEARPNILNIPPQDKWADDAFVGATVSWNIFDWGLKRAKVAEATARSGQARLRLSQLEDQIALEVREARIDLADTRQRLTVAERAAQSARRNLEVATDLWQNGLSRHSEVLDAHAQLTSTEAAVIAAKADLVLAQAALDHAVGVLSKR